METGRGFSAVPKLVRHVCALAVILLGAAACAPPPEPPIDPQAPVVSTFRVLGSPHVEPALVPIDWVVSDLQGDAMICRLDGDGDGDWDQSFDPCPTTASRNISSVGAGRHTARFEVSDGTHTTVTTATYTVDPPASTEGFDIVIRPSGPVEADVLAAFQDAASRWEQAIVRGLGDMAVTFDDELCGYNTEPFDGVVDDLVVNLSMRVIPPAAWAAPCVYGPEGLPRVGYVEVNPELLPGLRDLGVLDEIAVHELGHVLGFGTVGQFFNNVTGSDTVDPRFTGPRALAEYSLLGRSRGIPVMTVDGVMQPHWESVFFGPEIMATGAEGSSVSRLTIAAMADLGYSVDLGVADPYAPPVPAGTCIGFSETVIRCW